MKWVFLIAMFLVMYIDDHSGHSVEWLPKLAFLLGAINIVVWIIL